MMSPKNKKQATLMSKIYDLEQKHKEAIANMSLYDALHSREWHKKAESIGQELVYKKSLLFLGLY